MEIRMVSSNPEKIKETEEILKGSKINLIPVNFKIEELQTDDVNRLIRDKILIAFKKIGKPVFVEHTGLYIDYLNGFPGGLTQIFWDTLKEDKFAKIVGGFPDTKLTAKTRIAFCDGKQLYFFEGEVRGTVPKTPRGPRAFQWDCVFIPDGENETFAEMGSTRKNLISMRKNAFDEFKKYIDSIK